MEILQLIHFLNGRFDFMDITFSIGFWLPAWLWTRDNAGGESIFSSFDTKSICCMLSYSIVYLAHVIY